MGVRDITAAELTDLKARGFISDPPAGVVLQHTVTIDAAHLKDLVANPVTFLAAPGSGKMYAVHSEIAQLIFGTTQYDDDNGTASAGLAYGGASKVFALANAETAELIVASANRIKMFVQPSLTPFALEEFENQPILFGGFGNGVHAFLLGDSALVITATYSVVDLA